LFLGGYVFDRVAPCEQQVDQEKSLEQDREETHEPNHLMSRVPDKPPSRCLLVDRALVIREVCLDWHPPNHLFDNIELHDIACHWNVGGHHEDVKDPLNYADLGDQDAGVCSHSLLLVFDSADRVCNKDEAESCE